MASPWQNFKQEKNERWQVLHDGVPEWVRPSVQQWLSGIFFIHPAESFGARRRQPVFQEHIIRNIELNRRISLEKDLDINPRSDLLESSISRALNRSDQGNFLVFLELVIQYVRDSGDSKIDFNRTDFEPKTLLWLLEGALENGSKWKVVFDKKSTAGLVERADSNLTSIAKELNINLLTKAWNEAFAVNPDPEHAIEDAQKAIESAASETGLTAATTSVYGAVIGDIKANPSKYMSVAKEAFDVQDVLAKSPLMMNERFSSWFAEGLDLIQKMHPKRHHSKVITDFKLSPETGQQAVLIATLLCYLITRGYFNRERS